MLQAWEPKITNLPGNRKISQKLHPKLILTAGYYLLLHDLYLQLLSNLSHIVSYKKNQLIEENQSSTNKPSHWTFWPNTSCKWQGWVNKNQWVCTAHMILL
jgi:hypothetical protein